MNTDSDIEQQADWHQQLLSAGSNCPPGLTTWNGSDPKRRFDIYRNNVVVSLIDALADGYPVVQHLVGEEFFRAMSREFIRVHQPSSPVLAWYGAQYPDYIADFPPAASLPYLSDVARLERLRIESWHEADAEPICQQTLMMLLSNEAALERSGFVLHPAVRIFKSDFPVVSIWQAHQINPDELTHVDLTDINFSQQQAALLVRPELGVEIIPIQAEVADFIDALCCGTPLAQAAGICDNFDLSAALALLIGKGAIVGITDTNNEVQNNEKGL